MEYNVLPSAEIIEKTIHGLKSRNIAVIFVPDRAEALAVVKALIPAGAQVMTGGSATLQQIGFVDLLKSGQHPWKNYKAEILAEADQAKQAELRKKGGLAEFWLGSVQAITQAGQTLTASQSGSQLPAYAYTSPNVIWIAGAHKIVPTLEAGLRRIHEYALPLEDQRLRQRNGSGSAVSKVLIFENESSSQRTITLILVNEVLGY